MGNSWGPEGRHMNLFRHGNEASGNLIHFGPSRTDAGPSTKQTCWKSCFRPSSGPTSNSEPMRPSGPVFLSCVMFFHFSLRPCSVTLEQAGNGAEKFLASTNLRMICVTGNDFRKTERGLNQEKIAFLAA